METYNFTRWKVLFGDVAAIKRLLSYVYLNANLDRQALNHIIQKDYPELEGVLGDVSSELNIGALRNLIRQKLSKQIASGNASGDGGGSQLVADNSWSRTADSLSGTVINPNVSEMSWNDGRLSWVKYEPSIFPDNVFTTVVVGGVTAQAKVTSVQEYGITDHLTKPGGCTIKVVVKTNQPDSFVGKITVNTATALITVSDVGSTEFFPVAHSLNWARAGVVLGHPVNTGAQITFALDTIVPTKDITYGVETLGFVLLFKSTNWLWTGPLPDPDEGHGFAFDTAFRVQLNMDLSISWTGLVPPGGVGEVSYNQNHDVESLQDKVAVLDAVLASQIAAINSSDRLSPWISWLGTIGGGIQSIGAVLMFAEPVGPALMVVGSAISASASLLDGIDHADGLELGLSVLAEVGAAAMSIRGIASRMRNATKVSKNIERMATKELERAGKFATTMNLGISAEALVGRVEYRLDKITDVGSGPLSVVASATSELLSAIERGSELPKKIALSTNKVPTHGSTVAYIPDLSGAKTGVIGVDHVAGVYSGGPVSIDALHPGGVVTRSVMLATANGNTADLSAGDKLIEFSRPGGRGQARFIEARQWLDPETHQWRWDVGSGALLAGEGRTLAYESLSVEGRAKYLDETFGMDDKTIVVDSRYAIMGKTMIQAFLDRYAASLGAYDTLSQNCQTIARDLFRAASDFEMPSHWTRADETSFNLDFLRRANAETGVLSVPQEQEIIDELDGLAHVQAPIGGRANMDGLDL